MSALIEIQLLNGVVAGMIYALVAAGLTLIKPYYLLLGKPRSAMTDSWYFVDTVATGSYPVPLAQSTCMLRALR